MVPTSPLPTTTVRRNPPRRARCTPLATRGLASAAGSVPFSLDEARPADPPPPPPAVLDRPEPSPDCSERLKVFLRIRPLEIRPRKSPELPRTKGRGSPPKAARRRTGVCLVPNGTSSVTLSAPQSSSIDPKRSKSEVYDGFSFVFPPDSTQQEIFDKVMNPLVSNFMEGKSALLVAMGPTGSGKTHTMFGCPREPGMVPLALQKVFCSPRGIWDSNTPRSYCLSMFEICSERGKGERILNLLSDGPDLSLQQLAIKGLQEAMISNLAEAESLIARGMLKRSTAATNENSQSSRSQCIINIHSVQKSLEDGSDLALGGAVLTIADLAGAEREKRTGNCGARLLESSFINNTSMTFGLCLRSLLEHQRNPKKPLQKHFKNSVLTRYLRDYLEGRKKMTLILTVKPGEEDYFDTSFLLRQASPYMKIKFTNLEDFSCLPAQKRSNSSLICQENYKRRKCRDPNVAPAGGKGEVDVHDNCKISEEAVDSEKLQKIEASQVTDASLRTIVTVDTSEVLYNDLFAELQKAKKSEEIMRNVAKALWNVLKQYKQNLLESENASQSLRATLVEKNSEIMKLEKEIGELSTYCSCPKVPLVDKNSLGEAGVPSAFHKTAMPISASQDLKSTVDDDLEDHNTTSQSENIDFALVDSSQFLVISEDEMTSRKSRCCEGIEELKEIRVAEMPLASEVIESADSNTLFSSEQISVSMGDATKGCTSSDLDQKEYMERGCDDTEACTSEQSNLLFNGTSSGSEYNALLSSSEREETSREEHKKEAGVIGTGFTPEEIEAGGRCHQIATSAKISLEVVKPNNKCQVQEPLEKAKHDSPAKSCNSNKHRRRLLPSSTMLLKEFTAPDMDSDMPKVKASVPGAVRSQGSISLIQLLKSNLH